MELALTDAQKIDQLWGRLNLAEREKASLQLVAELAEAHTARLQERNVILEGTIESLTAEVRRLGKEVNLARVAALTAVENYRAAVRP